MRLLLVAAVLCSATAAAIADPFPFHCIPKNSNEKCVSDTACAWCQGGSLPGICVSTDEADVLINKIPGVKCDHQHNSQSNDDEDDYQDSITTTAPYDVKCLTAAAGNDDDDAVQDVCDGTTDSNGDPCVWCSGAGVFGLCLSTQQAAAASTYLQCDASTDSMQDANPLDTSCAVAAYQAEDDAQGACHGATDENGDPCIWCAASSAMGVCLNRDQADVAGQYLQCDDTAEVAEEEDDDVVVDSSSPYDISCALAGYTAGNQGESVCKSSNDADGSPCVWCDYSGQVGVCLTYEQSDYAEQVQFQCDRSDRPEEDDASIPNDSQHSVNEDDEPLDNPYDTTCVMAGFSSGNDPTSCEATQDEVGAPCHWCANGKNICLTVDQLNMVTQLGIDCGSAIAANDNNVEESNPYDITCAIAGYTAGDQGETICKSTQDQDGSACEWCSYGGQGVCLTDDQAQIAEQMQFECDSSTTEAAVVKDSNPYDVTCALAGFSAGADGESACDATKDQDGDACAWCVPQGSPQGLCLTQDQEAIAEQVGIDCGSDKKLEEANPYDITCAIAGYTAGDQGETVCKSTQDQDGSACEWCSYGGQGVCLTDDQAQIAEQMQFECDSITVEAAVVKDSNPYDVTCALAGFSAGADGESACDATKDQDGDACAWCVPQGSPQGLCLTQDQEAMAEQVGIDCGSGKLEEAANPYDITCAKAGAHGASACKATQGQDGGACEWCTYNGLGACLTDEQAQTAEQMQFECDSTTVKDSSPYDVTCALAGFSAGADGESACDATKDQDGDACAWCVPQGMPQGLCLTQDQEAIAEQAGIDCGSDKLEEANPYDITCAIAGYTAGDQGETICKSTQDQDGSACEWCSYGGQGVCLTDDQAQIAEQMQFECDSENVEATVEDSSPYDVTCALAGFSAGADGESACDATQDQDGNACAWCAPQGMAQGLCLTEDQEAIAEQVGIDCGSGMDKLEETNPYDITCAIAGYTAGDQGETICKSTQDQDGSACEWCSYSGQGVCLTDDQAQIAEQMQFECDSSFQANTVVEDSNPYDVTCALAGFSAGADGESACDATQDQDGTACAWCAPQGMAQGLCLTEDQEAIAEQVGIDCGSGTEKLEETNPYDVTCAIAGYTAGDQGETVCKSTQDQDGSACEWCSYGGQGVCLTDDQAQIAEQMQFECDSSFQANTVVEDSNPYDVTCALAGFSAGADGESACGATQDQDGNACAWCAPQGMAQGLCLTEDQEAIAEQVGIDCGSGTEKLEEANPYDITCAIAGYTAGDQGETICKSTQDQDGSACEWCSYGGQGVCLTDDQAQIAEQMQFECDSTSAIRDEVEVVKDPIPPTVKDCLKNVQEDACNSAKDSTGTKCSWCNTVAGFGLCFTEQAKEMAEAEFGPLFKCDDANTSIAVE